MAEGDANGNGGQGSKSANFGFLTRKIGPLPIWAYAAIAVGVYYWYTHYGPGASKNQNQKNNPVDPQTNQPYAQEVGRLREQVRIVRYQPRIQTGPGKRDTDHDKAQEKKVDTGGPDKGPKPPNVSIPPEQPAPDKKDGKDHREVIQTRWRGPYRAPKANQVEYVPAEQSEPDHRPLGV